MTVEDCITKRRLMRENSLRTWEDGVKHGKKEIIKHIKNEISRSLDTCSNGTDLMLDIFNLLTTLKEIDGEV